MPDRSSSICRYGILAAAFIAATGGIASVGRSQQLSGAIGASLTIVAPITAPQLRIAHFDIGRDGVARIETTFSSVGRTSQIVMVRISRVPAGSAPESPPIARFVPSSDMMRARQLVTIPCDLGADPTRRRALRIEYLIVAGT